MAITNIIISPKKWKKTYKTELIEKNITLLNNVKDNNDMYKVYMKKINSMANSYIKRKTSRVYGFTRVDKDFIGLNLKHIHDNIEDRNLYDNNNYDFYQLICETLTHEEMHNLIDGVNPGDYLPSKKYDNIYHKIRRNGIMA
jgi:hypothetical protein